MIRPICFMIMPYGTKDTQVPAGKGPAKVDFNALWEKAFAPLIDDLGYEPVRADQDLGALIIQEMLERLAISDLVLADTSLSNGNVYYEIGVRHAAKEKGCVLVGADWSKPLFDLDQMRRIPYPLPEETVTDTTAAEIRKILKEKIPNLADGFSPVFQILPGFPGSIDPSRASSLKQFMQKLSAFQAQVTSVRRAPKAEREARAQALVKATSGSSLLVPSLALEILCLLRDCTDWNITLDYIDGLPSSIRELPIVKEQRALAQSNAGDHFEAIGALEELIRTSGDTSERRGLIGGRYKKLYRKALETGDKEGAELYLDRAIDSYERGMKLDLNDYYPSSNLPRLLRTRQQERDEERAAAAAHIAHFACERAKERSPNDPWIRPTLLGAAFDAGDVYAAEQLFQEIRREGTATWKLDTTLADLELSIQLQQDKARQEALTQILEKLKRLR